MTRYILQRLMLLPLLMVIYSFVIFVIIQAPPGDFLTAYVATLASSGSSIIAGADRGVARAVRARPAVLRAILPVGAAPAARRFRPVAGIPAAQRRPDRRADRPHAGAGAVLLRADLGDRDPGRHLFGDPSALDRRPHPDGRQLCRRRHAQLHAGADPDVGGLRLFRHQRHRPLSRPNTSRRRGAGPSRGICSSTSGCRPWCWASPAPRGSSASCAPTCSTSSTSPTS